jgi:GNAT superfamily N-acetyltransferase
LTEATGIFDLREQPHHAAAVAERIWNAFWRHKETPLAKIRDGLDAIVKTENGVPFALVAEIDGRPCGNALVIDNDEPAKPKLTPWLAALWVDEEVRSRGIARALLDEAARRCQALGVPRLYLASRPALRDFYTGRGWRELEDQVGEHRLVLYARELGAVASRPRRSPPWT